MWWVVQRCGCGLMVMLHSSVVVQCCCGCPVLLWSSVVVV